MNMFGGSTQGQVLGGRALLSTAPAKLSLRGADHHTGQPELNRAGNSSGMLSPSADQYSGRTAMHDCAACSTCNSKKVLSPSTSHCCGQTTVQDWMQQQGDTVPLSRPMLWSDCKAKGRGIWIGRH